MNKIILGKNQEGKPVEIDLKILLRTRFLVQAASGGGKSQTLRRLAEQFFGKVPVWIIDRNDEFPSLRDKFGYVFAGPGGETPIDPRTAELVCEKLLKAKAPAIFGLYTLKDPDRHLWVKIFVEALMNAPKSLWTNLIVMIDEAHKLCPEKGQGESVAKEVVTDLAVDGRKRGFCAGYYTQRLGKLSKNASAELLNRMVGKTIEDLDVDRAVDLMSVRRHDRHDFEDGLKKLPPGRFWCFGEAISTDRVLVQVGGVQTKHPEPGEPVLEPPPLPEKMKAILPQLADLPKEAEQKARTEAEMKKEIASLRAQLASAQRINVAAVKAIKAPAAPAPKPEIRTETKIVEIPAISGDEAKRINTLLARMEKLTSRFDPVVQVQSEIWNCVKKLSSDLAGAVQAAEKLRKAPPVVTKPVAQAPQRPAAAAPAAPVRAIEPVSGQDLYWKPGKSHLAILRAILEFRSIGIEAPTRWQVAGWLGLKVTGSFRTNLSDLRTAGYIDYRGSKSLVMRGPGAEIAPTPEVEPTVDGILDHVAGAFSSSEAAILKAVHKIHPEWMTREDLAEAIGVKVTGSFRTNLSALHVAEVIEYGEGDHKNQVKCADWMFLGEPVTS